MGTIVALIILTHVIYKAGGRGRTAVRGYYQGRVAAWTSGWKGSSPAPAPKGVKAGAAIATGAVGGFLYARGFVKGMREGWPEGAKAGRAWYEQRRKKEAQAKSTEPGLCPDCRTNLAKLGWPEQHQTRSGVLCKYDWHTDPRWKRCGDCNGILIPGITECLDCTQKTTASDQAAKTDASPAEKPAGQSEPAAPDPGCRWIGESVPDGRLQCGEPVDTGKLHCPRHEAELALIEAGRAAERESAEERDARQCTYKVDGERCTDRKDFYLGNGYCTPHDAAVALNTRLPNGQPRCIWGTSAAEKPANRHGPRCDKPQDQERDGYCTPHGQEYLNRKHEQDDRRRTEQRRATERHLHLAASNDNPTTDNRGGTVPIETATGGDVRNIEQANAELDSIIAEQTAELEDAQAAAMRVTDDIARHQKLQQWVETSDFPADVVGTAQALAGQLAGRLTAAQDRIAAADGTLQAARQAKADLARHTPVKAAVDQAGGMAINNAYSV
ncbi:hypothetical protein ACQSSU_20865 [Micromonospora echinospora]